MLLKHCYSLAMFFDGMFATTGLFGYIIYFLLKKKNVLLCMEIREVLSNLHYCYNWSFSFRIVEALKHSLMWQ